MSNSFNTNEILSDSENDLTDSDDGSSASDKDGGDSEDDDHENETDAVETFTWEDMTIIQESGKHFIVHMEHRMT